MELYKKKLKKYKTVENSLKKVQKVFENVKKDLEKYVKESIVSRNYTIGRKELKYGYELFYPILSLQEGLKMQSEIFWCEYPEDSPLGMSEEPEVTHNYILLDENENVEIYVTEKSPRMEIEYVNSGIQLKIKNKILVMDKTINYEIKIGEMEFSFKRNFKDTIRKVLLADMLKDKYISYNDFKQTESFMKIRLTNRCCDNYLLGMKPDWRTNLENYIKQFSDCCDDKKIISDIEEIIVQSNYEKPIMKLYYLKEGYTLIVVISEIYNEYNCIFYEDEQMILELHSPVKALSLCVGYINQSYKENLDVKNQDIKDQDAFIIRLDDLDMEKPMNVLDMLNLS